MEDHVILILNPLIEILAGRYGVAGQVIAGFATFVGTLRLFFKPLMAAIEQIVKDTPSTSDDVKLQEIKNGLPFRVFVFIMDFMLSVKVPLIAKAAKHNEPPKT
jgi:hypothetical protein